MCEIKVENSTNAVLVAANESNFSFQDVAYLEVQGLWTVGWLCLLEYVLLWIDSKPLPPVHENLLSMSHAIFNTLMTFFVRTLEYSAYIFLWKNVSLSTNVFCNEFSSVFMVVLITDLGYYWFHRASHEVMAFWAVHQVHHSSQDLTVTVSQRHSPLQSFFSWLFYLPLAFLGVPPSYLAVQIQLNLLFQTWVHTCTFSQLGPLEWILNTPSHHRVHHGTNKHCLDKNFGGIFIFWDILFGTFQRELPGQEIVYGLVYQPDFWNIIRHQVFYLCSMVEKAKSMTTWKNFFETFFKGPSWWPGSTWTGRERDPPDFDDKLRRSRVPANSSLPINCYVFLHLLAAMMLLERLLLSKGTNTFCLMAHSTMIVATLTNTSILYEGKLISSRIESFRCSAGLLLNLVFPVTSGLASFYILLLFIASIIIWEFSMRLNGKIFRLREEFKEDIVPKTKERIKQS